MNPLHARPAADGQAAAGGSSLAGSDDVGNAERSPRYCPTELLASFALLMAGHGRCVSTCMMLGDREYAMSQLACARAVEDDAELALVAARLLADFEDRDDSAMPVVLGTA